MEGLLWKWTNYWSGWQPRWFILDEGILSYYKSREEVSAGSKGSVKMSVCDLIVNLHDLTRFDLAIPGEQHFFLKATNEKERQQWIVALGSCKASLQTMSDPAQYATKSKEQNKLDNGIRQKRSELRVYCDLLMQQVHSIKEASSGDTVDAERITECASLLSETCDTFIHSLEDCMRLLDKPLANRKMSSNPEAIPVNQPSSIVNPRLKHISRSPSIERQPPKSILRKPNRSVSQSSTDTDLDVPREGRTPTTPSQDIPPQLNNNIPSKDSSSVESTSTEHFSEAKESQEPDAKLMHLFNTMGVSFIQLHIENGVPTKEFLGASKELARVFDKMSATAFAPVKNDFLGNVKKIEQKWTTDPRGFAVLEKLVAYEIGKKQYTDPNSATQALLWLTRGLLFVSKILEHMFHPGELSEAVAIAYEATLKPFHNFVVRGVVSIAMKALPYKETFLKSLTESPDSIEMTADELLDAVKVDTLAYYTALNKCCQAIQMCYKSNGMIVLQI